MTSKKIYFVLGIDQFGQEYPVSKKQHSTPPQAAAWAKENTNLFKYGYQVKGVNVFVAEEEAPEEVAQANN